MSKLRLGFIGAGVMARWSIYPSLYLAPLELQAVCDLDEDLAKTVAGQYGTGRWYTDYEEMWAKEELDALIIQMHPGPRQAIVREALQSGYHVFVPKPPALSLAATQELSNLARQHNRVLMVNVQRRFSFAVTEAKRRMANPSFGHLTQLFCSFCSGAYDEVRGHGYDDPTHAYLLDFAVHHFDLARYLAGEVTELSLYHSEVGDGVAVALAVTFDSGCVGTFQLNSQRIWWRNYDRIELTGQGEYLILDGIWSLKHYREQGNTFTENYSDERSNELTGDGPALIEFVSAIQENREPIAGIHDSVETMRLYQTVYEAVKAGQQGVVSLL